MKAMIMTVPLYNTLLPMATAELGMFLDMQANIVESVGERNVAEIPVPGREGGILQDMGSKATSYTMSGRWIHENIPPNISAFRQSKLVPGFISSANALVESNLQLRNKIGPSASGISAGIGMSPVFLDIMQKIGWNWLRIMDIERLYYSKTPLLLMSDLTPGVFVLITGKRFRHVGGLPNVYDYQLQFKEWSAPLVKLLGATAATLLGPAIIGGNLGK